MRKQSYLDKIQCFEMTQFAFVWLVFHHNTVLYRYLKLNDLNSYTVESNCLSHHFIN